MPEVLSHLNENKPNAQEDLGNFEYETYTTHNWFIKKFPGIFLDASSLVKYFEYQRIYKSGEHSKGPIVKQLDKK